MSVVGAVFFQSKRGKASEHDVTDDISESGPRTGPWKSGPKSLDHRPNQGNPDHGPDQKIRYKEIQTTNQIKKIRITHRRSGHL